MNINRQGGDEITQHIDRASDGTADNNRNYHDARFRCNNLNNKGISGNSIIIIIISKADAASVRGHF